MPHQNISTKQKQNARKLRHGLTPAERELWRRLREEPFKYFKFRRQAVIGRFIADFVSFPCQLIIELDGGQHALNNHFAYDRERDAWFEKEGFYVLRFWNNNVIENINGVLMEIEAHLSLPLTQPACKQAGLPSPTRGEGKRMQS
jgi:very-short-patch-repair endonuclease